MTIAERLKLRKPANTPQEEAGAAELPRRRTLPKDVLILAALVLASTLGFGLGVLAGREGGEGKEDRVWIEKLADVSSEPAAVAEAAKPESSETPTRTAAPTAMPSGGEVVASKSGTKYYLPWCGAAKRIKEENRVWFKSKTEAEAAGYEPAKNCKGL